MFIVIIYLMVSSPACKDRRMANAIKPSPSEGRGLGEGETCDASIDFDSGAGV